jgi:cytochrome c-type biogenesis protein CcsB
MDKVLNILFSYWVMILLFILLGAGAGVATFIENDFGTSTARVLVYNHIWYEVVMVFACINLLGIIYRRKMWKQSAKFIFHISFVVMLLGAGITRYIGYEGIMHIKEGQTQSEMISLEPYLQVTAIKDGKEYYKEFPKEFSAIGSNDFSYDLKVGDNILNLSLAEYKFAKKGQATMNLITTDIKLGDETQQIKLVGQRGNAGIVRDLHFKDGTRVIVSYGSKPLKVPFGIKLKDFQLERYPGSMSPSSYASEVTVIDNDNNKNFDYRIFMNSTLQYGGYQFFQSSYDPDETGTILSVNKDPGAIPTYIGYFLLALGLLMNMFDRKSRFARLTRYIKQYNSFILIAIVAFAFNTTEIYAKDGMQNSSKKETLLYLEKYQKTSLETSKRFGKLVVQQKGRMKPVDSLNREILNKLYRKNSLMGMNADQVVMGMITRPDIWQSIKMLKIKTPKLKKELGFDISRNYVAFSELFSAEGGYKLKELVTKASAMGPNKRGTFENDILKLDERANIAYMVYFGNLFQIFPKAGDEENKNTKWYTPIDAMQNFQDKEKEVVTLMTRGFVDNVAAANYIEADKYLDLISQYQRKLGKNLIPSETKINNEILFNELGIFPKLTLAYVLLGIVLFILSFITVFNKNWESQKLNTAIFMILATLFLIQTFTMGHRWYISGHAPWSDTYESLVYIAWSCMFAGVIFFRKSLLALSATVVMAGVFMFTAHLTGIDPQITNLVPVLKSYWLTIHVSIITGSYGFLALGAMLGFMTLILFIFRDQEKHPHIDGTIYHITAINEAALILGLAMLTIGNFLGGVWANESWGRYWGWDPKETWAYVSIVFYALVIHLRFIPKMNSPFVFAVASTLVFSTILMTYFGVNFYLSGMHSYATGDPVPIPMWVYVLTALVFVVIALASRKRDLAKLKV